VNEERIMGVIPNYQTVNDPHAQVGALTVKQKWVLFGKSTTDPFNLFSAALGAATSQMGDDTPRYGKHWDAYGERFGAAVADLTTQSMFSTGLACVLHQDPRYFRKGPEYGIASRVAYSLSRMVVTRTDSGSTTFNSSSVFGMALGIAASNAYYPSSSRTGTVMAGRIQTSLIGGAMGNLMSEFWPDFQKKIFRHKKH
jgi:hypothetical protein